MANQVRVTSLDALESFRADLIIGLGVVHGFDVTAEGDKERERFDGVVGE